MGLFSLIQILVLYLCLCHGAQISEVFSWRQVQFKWPNEDIKKTAILSKAYIPENNIPLGIARWKNKLFVTLNRWKPGVASTLNIIELGNETSPLLTPYPSWEANLIWNTSEVIRNSLMNPIVSVFRVWVDPCDRLWVLDDGVDDLFGVQKTIVKKSILVFDLNTDKLLRRYYFKKSDVRENSVFGNIVVDTSSTCDDAFAYIADFSGFGLVVYSFSSNTSWRIKHLYFYPDPLAGVFLVGGITAHWIDGVLGLTLSDVGTNGYRTLYFHSLTSSTQFHVCTEVLQNQTWANSDAAFDDYKISGNRGYNEQSTTNAFDEISGIIFYTQLNRNGISCWNVNNPLNSETELVAESEELLEFPADLKIDRDRNLWVISNRLPKFLYGSHDKNQINIRILKIVVDEVIHNTSCQKSHINL